MVMDGKQTYSGDDFAVYINTESLGHPPETNIMLQVSYT